MNVYNLNTWRDYFSMEEMCGGMCTALHTCNHYAHTLKDTHTYTHRSCYTHAEALSRLTRLFSLSAAYGHCYDTAVITPPGVSCQIFTADVQSRVKI